MSEEELNKITWEEYKRLIEESEIICNELQEATKENKRLNNIIKEFKKWLEDEKEAALFDYHYAIEDVLNKLNELVGSDKE